jgi:hypothetical protein
VTNSGGPSGRRGVCNKYFSAHAWIY